MFLNSRERLRRSAGAAFVVAVGIATTALVAGPAHAVDRTGVQKCQGGAAPDEEIFIVQTAGGNANFPAGPDPYNGISPGNALHVKVEWDALVNVQGWITEQYNIDGKTEQATSGYPFPGWPKYANLFRMNNNPGGWVASGGDSNAYNPHLLSELANVSCFEAPWAPVRIGYGINDENPGDNSGEWRWTLQIWRNDGVNER
ncbi:hypothetical protein [Nocardia bovistercoris]|uniref:Secreted protein n=1 Tax=Nocardia bovistercoris TaxID=2785916 RepID=A0A931N6M3_9NOCA|nr:hypothetical protein [Nocardia bovistercoris]MBH0780892.1 hypothetical protein [Nocardia bovistercoris]